jgi:hypothetical protein
MWTEMCSAFENGLCDILNAAVSWQTATISFQNDKYIKTYSKWNHKGPNIFSTFVKFPHYAKFQRKFKIQ